jgi:hypothetical protein
VDVSETMTRTASGTTSETGLSGICDRQAKLNNATVGQRDRRGLAGARTLQQNHRSRVLVRQVDLAQTARLL